MIKQRLDLKEDRFKKAISRAKNYNPEIEWTGPRRYRVQSERNASIFYSVSFDVKETAHGRIVIAECDCDSHYHICKHVARAALEQYWRASKAAELKRKSDATRSVSESGASGVSGTTDVLELG